MVEIPSLHVPFSKIPMHLQKAVIHDMESKFGVGWSVKKIKKTNVLELQEIQVQSNKEDQKSPAQEKAQKKVS